MPLIFTLSSAQTSAHTWQSVCRCNSKANTHLIGAGFAAATVISITSDHRGICALPELFRQWPERRGKRVKYLPSCLRVLKMNLNPIIASFISDNYAMFFGSYFRLPGYPG